MALDFDATDTLEQVNVATSNAAKVLRGLIDAGERGAGVLFARLGPLAEQLDALLGDHDNPVPVPPTGGVPVDAPLPSDTAAAEHVGVVE